MSTNLNQVLLGLCLILSNCNFSDSNPKENESKYAEYIGRYAVKTDLILDVTEKEGLLTLLPSFWGSAQILDSIGPDKFASLLHPRMQFEFSRDSLGKIVSLTSSGNRELNGTAKRLAPDERQVVELLLAKDTQGAIQKIKSDTSAISEGRISRLGFQSISNYPSRAASTVSFVAAFENDYPQSVDIQQLIGLGSMLANDRDKARNAFRKAYSLDSTQNLNIAALRFLDPENASPPPEDSWKVSFSMDELFASPTEYEIAAVKKEWAGRDLSVKNVERVHERSLEIDGCKYTLQILQHEIAGSKHYGAVFIPEGTQPGSSPVVLDLHGVDPNYSPFNVMKAKTSKILGKNEQKMILALPAFRGYQLILEDQEYVSEGSPRNAWDGATDDALAFLNVVLDQIPEANPSKIAVFGKSRGGTVALLAGVRDDRIKCAVNWAGPASWYEHMGTYGFTLREQIEWGLWTKGRGWGSSDQFIEWFLEEHIETGSPDLKTIRHQILASSPLYFLDQLPTAQFHYGREDRSVPYANAVAIKETLGQKDSPSSKYVLFGHENTGHDQPYPKAFQLTKAFLEEELGK